MPPLRLDGIKMIVDFHKNGPKRPSSIIMPVIMTFTKFVLSLILRFKV